MKTSGTLFFSKEDTNKQIQENFKNSDLTAEQYIKACKQYLYARKNDSGFVKLSSFEQESYLITNNVLGYRFFRDRGLVEVLKNFKDIALTEIYSIITPKSDYVIGDIDFLTLLNDKDNILITNAEMFLDKLSKICSVNKNITLWSSSPFICDMLFFDYGHKQNISIKTVDLYKNEISEQGKFKNIICAPPTKMHEGYKRCATYACGPSASAAELLFINNLTEDGILTAVMPDKINKISGMEEHFRQVYVKNLVRVIDLSGKITNTNMRYYLYQFSKTKSESIIIQPSIDDEGEEFKLSDFVNIDSSWDFRKPFKKADKDMLKIFSNENCKTLSEIATVLRGKPLSKSKFAKEARENENFIYIDMKAIKEDGINFSETEKYIIDKKLTSEYLENRDILMPNKGSNTSKIVLYNKDDKNCIASDNLIVIRPDTRVVDSEYLLIYLKSKIGQKLIKEIQRETTMLYIKHKELETIPVIVPLLFEQKKLVRDYKAKKESYKKELEKIKSNMEKLEQDLADNIFGTKQGF